MWTFCFKLVVVCIIVECWAAPKPQNVLPQKLRDIRAECDIAEVAICADALDSDDHSSSEKGTARLEVFRFDDNELMHDDY